MEWGYILHSEKNVILATSLRHCNPARVHTFPEGQGALAPGFLPNFTQTYPLPPWLSVSLLTGPKWQEKPVGF